MLDDPETFEVPWSKENLVKLSQETVLRLVKQLSKTIDQEIVCSKVAPGWGHLLKLFKHRNATYSIHDWHAGNCTVEYEANDMTERCCGRICNIFTIRYGLGPENSSITDMWVEVERFKKLGESDNSKHPYSGWPHIKTTVVYSQTSPESNERSSDVTVDLIKPDKILGHMACLEAPSQTFGIEKPILILIGLSRHHLSPLD
jgi:hypothetical protein